jgi:hypothetical protein
MIEVIPFHGLLYDTKVTGPLIEVTAPPYDVIPPALQESLYQKNPHNIVRLILGKEFSTDSEMDNRYIRASKTFRQWLEEGVLVRDSQPGFYLYSQEYEFEGGNSAGQVFSPVSKQKLSARATYSRMSLRFPRPRLTAPTCSMPAMLISALFSDCIRILKAISILYLRTMASWNPYL